MIEDVNSVTIPEASVISPTKYEQRANAISTKVSDITF